MPKRACPSWATLPTAAPPIKAIIIPCNTGVGNLATVSAIHARTLTKAVRALVTPSPEIS